MRKTRVNFNTITIQFGTYAYDEADTHDAVIYKTKKVDSIPEFEFYKKFLQIKNIIRKIKVDGKVIDIRLTESCIELMAHIMTKDLDFNVNWKNNSQQLKDLGAELDRTPSSIYKSYIQLKKKMYFITTEDKLVIPNEEINKLRKRIKSSIKNNGHSAFDINFEFCIA